MRARKHAIGRWEMALPEWRNARARDACAARYKSGSWQRAAILRRRRHTRASTDRRDEPAGRIAPKNSSLSLKYQHKSSAWQHRCVGIRRRRVVGAHLTTRERTTAVHKYRGIARFGRRLRPSRGAVGVAAAGRITRSRHSNPAPNMAKLRRPAKLPKQGELLVADRPPPAASGPAGILENFFRLCRLCRKSGRRPADTTLTR